MFLSVVGDSSREPYVVFQQVTDGGVFGDIWNQNSGAWEEAPSTDHRKVYLTSISTIGGQAFGGGVTRLGTYTGWVVCWIFDDATGELMLSLNVYFNDGYDQRDVVLTDITSFPADIQTELTTNPVPSSNMRGTDSAFLAASWVAPDNTTIATIDGKVDIVDTNVDTLITETALVKTAAQSADGKLPADASTKIDRLDATISSRSSHSAADVRSELNANPVPASNMRGTDDSFLAANWVAPDNTSIGNALTQATNAASDANGLRTDLTTARAAKLDNIVGQVATSAEVSGISNVVRSKLIAPTTQELPESGTLNVRLELAIYTADGDLIDPDGNAITWTASNQAGTDRSGNLSGATRISAGRYRVDYTLTSTDAKEVITFFADYTEDSTATQDIAQMNVVENGTNAGSFTATDRTKLDALHGKLGSRAYFAMTDAADGDINLDNLDGDKSAFHADQTVEINAARDAIIAHGDGTWDTATGFLATTDTRLDHLDADISSRSTFAPAGEVASAASITALQAHGDVTWATASGFLTAADARLNNLDALISSRSTFDVSSEGVTLATGHGLADKTTLDAINAKTANLPANPAATSDVPTAGNISSQVESTLATVHGAGSWATSDATLAKQNEIITAIGGIGGGSALAAQQVAKQRTWVLSTGNESSIAPQVITLRQGEDVTLAMDFGKWFNDNTALVTVSSVTDSESALTIDTLLVDQSRRRAHFDVSNLVANKRHTIEVTVSTSDGQTMIGSGVLEVI